MPIRWRFEEFQMKFSFWKLVIVPLIHGHNQSMEEWVRDENCPGHFKENRETQGNRETESKKRDVICQMGWETFEIK